MAKTQRKASTKKQTTTTGIKISVGRQGDGGVYELHPLSEMKLMREHPDVRRVPSVFVGYRSKDEFESLHGPLWPQIAMMLTGLSWEQLQQMGGVTIEDVVNGRDIEVEQVVHKKTKVA